MQRKQFIIAGMDSAFFRPLNNVMNTVLFTSLATIYVFLNLRRINIAQMMFWSDNNFSVFIVANFWVDHSRFIMQDSSYSDVIIGFNWTCNSQLSIHIDFTTLKGFDILPNPDSDN